MNLVAVQHEAAAERLPFRSLALRTPYAIIKISRVTHDTFGESIRALLRSNEGALVSTYLPGRTRILSDDDLARINADAEKDANNPPTLIVTGHVNQTCTFELIPPN